MRTCASAYAPELPTSIALISAAVANLELLYFRARVKSPFLRLCISTCITARRPFRCDAGEMTHRSRRERQSGAPREIRRRR